MAEKRFILMKASSQSESYLYNYATVVGQVGQVKIVQVESESPDFHAKYQLGRLQSGMESASGTVFESLAYAEAEAARVAELWEACNVVIR